MTQATTSEKVNTLEKIEVSNYPYGGMRTKAFFSIEFNEKRGFRNVFQTINPKNGVLNKPKKSTYSFFEYLQITPKDGTNFVNTLSFRLPHDVETLKAFARSFMSSSINGVTEEMYKYIAAQIITSMRVTLAFTDKDKQEDLKNVFKPYIKILADMYKTGINRLGEIENV